MAREHVVRPSVRGWTRDRAVFIRSPFVTGADSRRLWRHGGYQYTCAAEHTRTTPSREQTNEMRLEVFLWRICRVMSVMSLRLAAATCVTELNPGRASLTWDIHTSTQMSNPIEVTTLGVGNRSYLLETLKIHGRSSSYKSVNPEWEMPLLQSKHGGKR